MIDEDEVIIEDTTIEETVEEVKKPKAKKKAKKEPKIEKIIPEPGHSVHVV